MGQVCKKNYSPGELRFVQDALYVLNGKWKLEVIAAIAHGNNRFSEIKRSLPGITTRALSKALKELELNYIVERQVEDNFPPVVVYNFSAYSKVLAPMIDQLITWGAAHREKIFQKESCRSGDIMRI